MTSSLSLGDFGLEVQGWCVSIRVSFVFSLWACVWWLHVYGYVYILTQYTVLACREKGEPHILGCARWLTLISLHLHFVASWPWRRSARLLCSAWCFRLLFLPVTLWSLELLNIEDLYICIHIVMYHIHLEEGPPFGEAGRAHLLCTWQPSVCFDHGGNDHASLEDFFRNGNAHTPGQSLVVF